ncbi:DNA polymerase III subunit beta [Tepidibacillus fermentans]|uniref:Beta sliding clamp n=1 Tax=Tepidibacillus fermentans TaxID=1281767 RepID=A0A4R3KCL8_9BACI|nr:DNA polymerase III subunit beta [Tepidibacillus fermentans]TCS80825.1 DNA polymerase-3 subunit beta [Tepidibacillus fermentans]
MHFIIDKSQLMNGIQHVNKAVSTKTTIPILTGIKFDLTAEGLTLIGSDSDISIQIFIPKIDQEKEYVKIYQEGKIVLPAKYIVEIVKKLPSDEIEFEQTDHLSVIIRSGRTEFRLNGYDAEEFPNLPQIEEEQVFKIQSDLLKSMIRQTLFAVHTLESRPILTGVLWELENHMLKFVATDSHRLATRTSMVETLNDTTFHNIVVPGKSLNELSKILEDEPTTVQIIVTENQIQVKMKHLLFYSRLLDGTYPDTSRIIPDKFKTNLILSKQEFADAIERALLIAKDDKNNIVKFTTQEHLMVELSSNSQEVGHVTEQIQANEIDGDQIKISFNAKYVLEALKAIDSQEIRIEFTGALSPFVIKPVDHDWALHLILPVRTY